MAGGKNESGRKDDSGKLRYDLIPTGPLEKLAEVYTIGAKKYSDRNWERGLSWGRLYGALQRHANAFWRGESRDPVDGQHHLASVAFCAFALLEFERTHPELDDRANTGRVLPHETSGVTEDMYDKLLRPQQTDPGDRIDYGKLWEGGV
jgi:dATP/dGTP diphosphohydrolase